MGWLVQVSLIWELLALGSFPCVSHTLPWGISWVCSLSSSRGQKRSSRNLNAFFQSSVCIQITTIPLARARQRAYSFLRIIIISTTDGSLNSRNVFPHISGSESPRPRCCLGWFLLKPVAYRWLSSPWSFLNACLWPNFPFLSGHQSYWVRSHPNDLILTYPLKGPFSKYRMWLHSEVLVVRTLTYECGWDTIQPITCG